MASSVTARELDGGKPNTDALGIAYVLLAVIYTVVLIFELILLYQQRSAFCVRIRGFKLIVATVSLLHIYLVLVLLVYPWNGLFPCSAEFWIMSLFLPSGMALFQACNAKVITAYESQRRMTRNFLEGARRKRISWTPRGLWEAWWELDAAHKVQYSTVAGLVFSFLPSLFLFLGSRRFHPSFGIFGQISDWNSCRRGFEWIPSILVQVFWTLIVGPWILWRIRQIQDVHSWAWQARLAIIAGLPGTPLWIAFTYSRMHAIWQINRFFPSAGWFIPSLLVCQQVLVLIPLRGAMKSQRRQRSMSISETESLTSESSAMSIKSTTFVFSKELRSKTSMQALEFSIEHGIESLIAWAASREFTAENAIFLREIRNFKRKWITLEKTNASQRQQMFHEASLIFFTLVNPFTAEAPINIEYKVFKALQDIFANVEFDPYMPRSDSADLKFPPPRENVICPWEDVLSRPASMTSANTSASISSTNSIIPSQFSEDIFDAAFESIKYLVFTNTWPRYITAGLGDKVDSP